MKVLKDFNVKDKRVLVRCDFNVPISDNGEIIDDFRIRQTLPTIQHLILAKAKVVLMSHLQNPDGKVVPNLRLNNIAKKISEYLKIKVAKADDCIGDEVKNYSYTLGEDEILLLENLRFHKEEKENNIEFAKKISELGDIYINDAFSVCHREHTSIVGIPKYLPHGAGLLLEKEIEVLEKVLKNSEKPMVIIIGGTKVEAKAKFIDKILEVADFVIVSGLIKKEIIEKNLIFKNPQKIIGPIDNLDALDIDQKSINNFKGKILSAKTIVWNGPFGRFEDENYKKGTQEIAKAIIKSGAFCVAGGGETIEFLRKEGMIGEFSHISTGGGAMLNYLEGDTLPGLKALQ